MAIYGLENIIGVELGYNGQPKGDCKIKENVYYDQVTVNHCCCRWFLSKKGKNRNNNIKSIAVTTITSM